VRPLRVLYLIDSLVGGGAQRQLVTLVNALDRAEVEPTIAVYHTLDHFRPELERTGTRIVQVGTSGAKDPAVLFRLAGLLRREDFDLVHCYMRVPGILARAATLLGPRVPIVLSERNVDLGHSRFRLFLERILSGRAAAVIANAEAVRERVETKMPALRGRVFTVLNGVEARTPTDDERERAAEFRSRHLGNGRFLLSVVARISEQKNPHLLLDSLEALPADESEAVKVVWVGNRIDEELARSLEARLEKSPLRGRLEFLPPTRDTAAVYLASDAVLLTSSWEGLPNAVLEAMSYGLPVVATDAGGTRELVVDGRTGWLVPRGDASALGGAISGLIKATQDERSQLGRAGAERARELCSVKQLVRNTIDVYRSVLGGQEPGDPEHASEGGEHE